MINTLYFLSIKEIQSTKNKESKAIFNLYFSIIKKFDIYLIEN